MLHDGEIDRALLRLSASGWSIGDAKFVGGADGNAWTVYGRLGSAEIRADGPSRVAAWRKAVELAEGLGLIDRA